MSTDSESQVELKSIRITIETPDGRTQQTNAIVPATPAVSETPDGRTQHTNAIMPATPVVTESPIVGMFVTKRDGRPQAFSYDAIQSRIVDLSVNPIYGPSLDPFILDARRLFDMMKKIYDAIEPGMSTTNIDINSADIVSGLMTTHPDYGKLAARICVSNLHKQTPPTFREAMIACHNNVHYLSKTNPNLIRRAPLVDDDFVQWLNVNGQWVEALINYQRDYDTDIFAFKTMENSYLWRTNALVKDSSHPGQWIMKKVACERPQHMYMRQTLAVADMTQEAIKETYDALSLKYYTHATPTIINAKRRGDPNYASCFLISIPSDSIQGIHTAEGWLHEISAKMGGVGINVSNIRMNGAYVAGVDGVAQGVVPMIKVMNQIALHITQGGKRKGSFAFYIEPWHGDIYEFLNMHSGKAAEHMRAMESFFGLMVNDLFMKRVEEDAMWSLFCPSVCPELVESWGEEFERNYVRCEKEGKAVRTVRAADLYDYACQQIVQTGYPYWIFKDHVNRKSNQQHLGTIKELNLCTEIAEYTSPDEIAVCNLASVAVNMFVHNDAVDETSLTLDENRSGLSLLAILEKRIVDRGLCKPNDFLVSKLVTMKEIVSDAAELKGAGTARSKRNNKHGRPRTRECIRHVWFNGTKLRQITALAVRNLNNVIDRTSYPLKECANSNLRHRPIGVGVQGFGDAIVMLRMPMDSEDAQAFNRILFETMYLAAVQESCRLVKSGARECYVSFRNYKNDKGEIVDSPMSKGIFQFDMWTDPAKRPIQPSKRYADEWKQTKADVVKYGMCNSLLLAPMPTATTSLLMGNSQSFDPVLSNIYVRRTLMGEFVCYNKNLVADLTVEGLWNNEMKEYLIANNGSIQKHPSVPIHIKQLYKRACEVDPKVWTDMAGYNGRGPFIDQTHSFNIHTEYKGDELKEYLKHHFQYAHKSGLKTAVYYVKQAPAVDPIKFSISAHHHVDDSRDEQQDDVVSAEPANDDVPACRLNDPDCVSCSS